MLLSTTVKIIDFDDLSDIKSQTKLEEEVTKVIENKNIEKIIVDLTRVSFVLSFTITQIVRLFRHCKKNKILFQVDNAGKTYDTFKMLKLTKLFEVNK